MSGFRVMIWVQHLMGIGHQRRAALITRQLCQRGVDVCYVSGGFPLPGLNLGGARQVQLPPARAADVSYQTLLGDDDRPVTDNWRRKRKQALLESFDAFIPHALITESYPFGRGLLRFELEPLLQRVRRARHRTRLLCSVRDIVQPRGERRNAATVEIVRSCFDAVLVHSDPAIIDFAASFPSAGDIRERIRYTGYVAEYGGELAQGEGKGVLVSGGGGVVAERLLQVALEARPLSRLKHQPWRILAGPDVGDHSFRRLKAHAGDGAQVERNRADFSALLAACRVSVSQGGYNTLLDVVAARARAVVVPFSDGEQSEQPARARLFKQKHLVEAIVGDDLNPAALAAAVDQAAEAPRPPAGVLDLGGAARSAELVLEMLEERA